MDSQVVPGLMETEREGWMMTTPEVRIDYLEWNKPKPFGISGCFRLRNESQFMETAILSHLPFLDEAVLAVQPSEDDTLEIAQHLAEENPKIRVVLYPYIVDWIDTPGFYSKDPNQPGHWVHLSNWAMAQCNYSWIAKTEGDVICLSSFERIVERIKARPNDHHYYGRVILNVAGERCNQFSCKHPRNAGWDECVVPNHPTYHFERVGKFESLYIGPERTCMGWSGLHMKRCKKQNIERLSQIETWKAFTRESVREELKAFNQTMEYQGIDDPLGEDCLYEKEWIEWYLGRVA
jgi:hypothetical protein